MRRCARAQLLLLLPALAALLPPAAAATRGFSATGAFRAVAARIATGRDDVTERQQQGKTWDHGTAAEQPECESAGEKRRISAVTLITEDALPDGEAEGVRKLLKNESQRRPEAESEHLPMPSAAPPPASSAVRTRHARSLSDAERATLSKKLIVAAQSGYLEEMRQLIDQGADVNFRNDNRETALHWSACIAHTEGVKLLIENGATVDARTSYFYAPLNFAAMSGCAGCIQALAAAGANVNARNRDGWTPLHEAALYNQLEAVKALLAVGADPAIRNSERKPPRDYTTSNAVRAILPKFD